MPIKVGINGFGRIGRNIMRTALDDKDIQFVAVNDVTDAKTLAHLLKYDSVLGNLPNKVTHTDDSISVDGKTFKVFKTKDPAEIDWASVGADIVVESIRCVQCACRAVENGSSIDEIPGRRGGQHRSRSRTGIHQTGVDLRW